jgi:hypothetical protein
MLVFRFFLLSLYFHWVFAKPVTTIIDDAFAGDSDTSILYSPSNAWGLGSTTGHGRIAPDPSLAQDETWHDTTDDTTPDHDGTTPTFMEVNFQGENSVGTSYSFVLMPQIHRHRDRRPLHYRQQQGGSEYTSLYWNKSQLLLLH